MSSRNTLPVTTVLNPSVSTPIFPTERQRPSGSLSSKLWDINWSTQLPVQLSGGEVTVEYSSYADTLAFIRERFPEIYHGSKRNGRFLDQNFSSAKEAYYAEAGDFFQFCSKGQVVGVFIGTALDWGSYYARNASILPEFQGRGYYQEFLRYLGEVLGSHGVERVEGDVAPSNVPHIQILQKTGFVISGMNLSERWGALLHFVWHLSTPHKQVFQEQFCHIDEPLRVGLRRR